MNYNFNENRLQFDPINQVSEFQNDSYTDLTNHYSNTFNLPEETYNQNITEYPFSVSTEKIADPIWYKPENYSNRSIGIQIGNDTHQVFVYEDEHSKNTLVSNSLNNNCSFKSSEPYYMYSTLDNLKFRSKAEVIIYFVLKGTGIFFLPNSSAISFETRKEPDFLVIYKGRTFILDILNNETHSSEKDAETARFYQNHGVSIRSYSNYICETNPYWVVQDFLQWINNETYK